MDESMEDVIRNNFWILPAVGNSFAFLKTKGWLIFSIINGLVGYTGQIVCMALLSYTAFLIKDNVALLSQAGHFIIVGAVSMTASVTLNLFRKKVGAFNTLLSRPKSLAPYNNSEYFARLSEEWINKRNRNVIFWFLMYGSCGVIGICQPLIDSLAHVTVDVKEINGVWINLPIAMWAPFDLENNFAAWMGVFMFQGIFMLYCAIQVISAIVLCFGASDLIQAQLKSCFWAMRHIDDRAREMFKQRYPLKRIKDMPMEHDNCYYECIVQTAEHHLRIKEEFEKFIDLATFPIAVPFLGGAILLGMALITITAHDDPRIGPKCLAFMMATSEAINMYNLCKAGQDFLDISREIHDAIFYTKWFKRSAKCKKALILLRTGCDKPLILTATRLLTMNMATFSDLVNSAYSLFNLMNASGDA